MLIYLILQYMQLFTVFVNNLWMFIMIYMINPKSQRFYWLDLQQDLFKDWCIRKIYGGLKNNYKHEVWIPFANKQMASKQLTELEYAKRQKGYIYADIQNPEHYHLTPQTISEVLQS